MAVELDPLFLKAIALLHSRHPDSGQQLQTLIQNYRDKLSGDPKCEKVEKRDAISGTKSPKIAEKPIQIQERSKSPIFTPTFSTSLSAKPVETVSKTSAMELVETVEELSSSAFHQESITDEQLDAGMVESLAELNSSFGESVIEELSSSSLLELEPITKKQKIDVEDEHAVIPVSHEDESHTSVLEESVSLDLDGPMCCVCQSHETDSADNCLVECHECHNYYHQRCHKPPMTNKDVHDPRFVLYCSQCSKRMRKEMQQAAQQSTASSSTVTQETKTAAKPVTNPFQLPKAPFQQPFRRPPSAGNPETSKNIPSTSASLTSGNGNNGGQAQNSQRGSAFLPQNAQMKSMKRLELVKKRAKIQQQMRKR
eukprot:gene16991-18703_t